MEAQHPMKPTEAAEAAVALADTRCTATSKQSGDRCRNKAIPGGNVCRFHGGDAPQVRAAALARIVEARDLALAKLISGLDELGDEFDPRVLLDIVTKLTDKAELLEGRATARQETIRIDATEVRNRVLGQLDELERRRQARLKVVGE